MSYSNQKNLSHPLSFSEIRSSFLATLSRGEYEDFGILVDGNVISEVVPGYPAARSGKVQVGDEILAVDKTKVNETVDVIGLLAKAGKTVHLSMSTNVQSKLDLYIFAMKNK